MNTVAAVVVTYNRLELLKQNIDKLLAQTCPCDILLVDNASTDGTGEAMRALEQTGKIQYRNTGANLGGAGGFNFGMRWAVEAGYRYVWVMDDDCLPKPDALEKLLEADQFLGGPENYGFLSSSVLWTDGRECVMNRQKIAKDFYRHVELLKHGVIQIQQHNALGLEVIADLLAGLIPLGLHEHHLVGGVVQVHDLAGLLSPVPVLPGGESGLGCALFIFRHTAGEKGALLFLGGRGGLPYRPDVGLHVCVIVIKIVLIVIRTGQIFQSIQNTHQMPPLLTAYQIPGVPGAVP